MSKRNRPAEKQLSIIEEIPRDVQAEIAAHSSVHDLIQLMQSSRKLREDFGLAIWRHRIQEDIFSVLDKRPDAPATPSIARILNELLDKRAFYALSVDALQALYLAIMDDLASAQAWAIVDAQQLIASESTRMEVGTIYINKEPADSDHSRLYLLGFTKQEDDDHFQFNMNAVDIKKADYDMFADADEVVDCLNEPEVEDDLIEHAYTLMEHILKFVSAHAEVRIYVSFVDSAAIQRMEDDETQQSQFSGNDLREVSFTVSLATNGVKRTLAPPF